MCGVLDFPAASRLEVGWAVLLIAAALMATGSKSAESKESSVPLDKEKF